LLLLTPLLPLARRQHNLAVVPLSVLAFCVSLTLSFVSCPIAGAQAAPPAPLAPQDNEKGLLPDWAGLQVVNITFDGVSAELLKPLPSQLAQQPGAPLDPEKIRESLRSLYATGLYQTIEVAGIRAGDSVTIVFTGLPRLFVGRVNVEGVKDERLDAVLDSATGRTLDQDHTGEQWLLPRPDRLH
jgi:outer membrane protein insertion porin family